METKYSVPVIDNWLGLPRWVNRAASHDDTIGDKTMAKMKMVSRMDLGELVAAISAMIKSDTGEPYLYRL